MKRNDRVTAGELAMGDRFYILNESKSKNIWEVQSTHGHYIYAKYDGRTRKVKSDKAVVFLRSTEE